jgi:hypothetical protein
MVLILLSTKSLTNKKKIKYIYLHLIQIKYNLWQRSEQVFISTKVWLMMLNATFNNISVISWHSVLLVEETRVPRENHRSVASH